MSSEDKENTENSSSSRSSTPSVEDGLVSQPADANQHTNDSDDHDVVPDPHDVPPTRQPDMLEQLSNAEPTTFNTPARRQIEHVALNRKNIAALQTTVETQFGAINEQFTELRKVLLTLNTTVNTISNAEANSDRFLQQQQSTTTVETTDVAQPPPNPPGKKVSHQSRRETMQIGRAHV